MAVNLPLPKELLDISGVSLGVAAAGIKYENRTDVLLMSFSVESLSSAVFTQNKFCAAPVFVAKEHIAAASPKALLINSGNANAVTGEQGLQDAKKSCELVAKALNIATNEVLPFSTGVIGELLPMDAIDKGVTASASALKSATWLDAAKSIMTTDTQPKAYSFEVDIQGEPVKITGISKGSGMICPNMATMLGYVVTDAKVSQEVLDVITKKSANASFNSITVDGDTSTNDAYVVTATQQANNVLIDTLGSSDAEILEAAITYVAMQLAQAIVRDGEGATKFVEIKVSGGACCDDCSSVAYSLAHSPLVKTALFAQDPNWGRLLMAIGKAPVSSMDADKVSVIVNGLPIVVLGQPHADYTEEKGQAVFNEAELKVEVSLGDTDHHKTVWTTDLSHEYVTINAEYRS